jgi:hypothetical protein
MDDVLIFFLWASLPVHILCSYSNSSTARIKDVKANLK